MWSGSSMPIRSVVFGLSGEALTQREVEFFRQVNPLGFIFFNRNIRSKQQLSELCMSLRELLKREDVLFLIDQEGGRVARLKPPIFRECHAAKYFADLAAEKGIEEASKVAYQEHYEIGVELKKIGINVNCAPVVDLFFPFGDNIIGDRSFGESVEQVVALAGSAARGLMDAKVVPIMKHIPGHGRANLDSHRGLPQVNDTLDELIQSDFEAFKRLEFIPMAMTAHIVYSAIDSEPATLSSKVISMIRETMGYNGIIISDDLTMKALYGSYNFRAEKAFEAGCEILLHCSGIMHEMVEMRDALPFIDEKLAKKLDGLKSIY